MAWEKGESGNPAGKPRGSQRDKPYREALRMELAKAGDNLKALREIAAAHIEKAKAGDMQAIKELGDRLDGKPAQEAHITIDSADPREWPTPELDRRIEALTAALAREETKGNGKEKPHRVH